MKTQAIEQLRTQIAKDLGHYSNAWVFQHSYDVWDCFAELFAHSAPLYVNYSEELVDNADAK